MDDNEKRLEILRRTKKRRKQVDITFILAALAVLFLLAGIYLGQALSPILPALVGLVYFKSRVWEGRTPVHKPPAQGSRNE